MTLLSFSDQPQGVSEAAEVRSLCSEAHVVPWREFDPVSFRAGVGFLSLKPRSIVDTFSPEMAEKISIVLRKHRYDLVIASQLPMAAYFPFFTKIPAIFEELEIGLSLPSMDQNSGLKNRLRQKITWMKLSRYLARLLNSFQAVTVVSDRERELVLSNFPKVPQVAVIPNCLDLQDYREARAEAVPDRLVFSGSFRYRANYESMQWFIGKVFPLVLNKIPTANLIITGDHAGLPLPSEQNVTRAGHVEDIRSLIASSAVAVAPLLSGGGTRLKILEAFALGVPVVSTSKGAEGLDAVHEMDLMRADDAVGFAESVIRILEDPNLRRSLSSHGRKLVEEKYSFEVMSKSFESLLQGFKPS